MTDPDGNVTSYVYDSLNRQIETIDPLHVTSSAQYDLDGNVVQTTDSDGHTIQYAYDADGRQTQENWLNSAGSVFHTIQTSYDAAGETLSVVEWDASAGNATSYQYAYDGDGQVTRVRMAPGDLPQPGWNQVSATLSDPSPADSHFVSNLTSIHTGDVIEVTIQAAFVPVLYLKRPNGSYAAWKATGNTLTIAFIADDPGDNSGTWPSDSGETWQLCIGTANGGTGNFTVTWQVNPALPATLAEVDYAHDADGNVTSVSDTSMASSGNWGQTAYQYDSLGRVSSAEQYLGGNQTGNVNELASFGYNDNSSLSSVNRYANAAETTLVATSTYGYDKDGRLTSLDHTQGATTLNDYSPIGYDLASNVTSVTSTLDGTTSYTGYDASNQLTAVAGASSLHYDQNGNRTGGGYVTGADNRLLSDGTYNYTYDQNGNLVKQVQISNNYETDFTWDYENRLTSVTYKNNFGAIIKVVTYTNDYLGNAIREGLSNSTTWWETAYTYTVYSGGQPLLQFSDSTPLSGGTATETDRYLNANGHVLADDQLANGVGPVWILPDYKGSAVDLVAYSSGQWVVARHSVYSPFGVTTSTVNHPGTSVASVVGWDGGLTDSITGLIKFDARWYNPVTTVWIGPDPSGFASGDPNFYSAFSNNPASNVDPLGLGSVNTQVTDYGPTATGPTLTCLNPDGSEPSIKLPSIDPWGSAGATRFTPLQDTPQLPLSGPLSYTDTSTSPSFDLASALNSLEPLPDTSDYGPPNMLAATAGPAQPSSPKIVQTKQLGFTGEDIDFDASGQAYYHGIPIVSVKPMGDGIGLGDRLIGDSDADDLNSEVPGALAIWRWLLNTVDPAVEPNYLITFKPGATDNLAWDSPYAGNPNVLVLSGGLTTGQITNEIITVWSIASVVRGAIPNAPAPNVPEIPVGSNEILGTDPGGLPPGEPSTPYIRDPVLEDFEDPAPPGPAPGAK